MAKAKTGKWVQKVTQSPSFKKGALRATAARHGALKNGIDAKWLDKAASGKGVSKKTAQRARFAKTLKGMRKPKAKK